MEDTELISRCLVSDGDIINKKGANRGDSLAEHHLQDAGEENEICLNKRRERDVWTFRYIGLAALCVLYFMTLVTYDCPGALQTSLMKEYSYSLFDFSRLLSSYSWASIFCTLGGYYVDRVLGLNLGVCAFVLVFCIGNIFYSAGMYLNTFWIMIIGRLCAGLGGETLSTIVSCYILHWFADGSLNLAFALSNSFSLLAPAFTYQISSPIYNVIRNISIVDDSIEFRRRSLASATTLICGSASFLTAVCGCIVVAIYNVKGQGGKKQPQPKDSNKFGLNIIKSIFTFQPVYWTLTCYTTLVYTTMYNFISLSQDYFVSNFGMNVDEADDLISHYSFITFLAAPLTGYLVDRGGNNMVFLGASTVAAIISHSILVFTKITPSIPVVMLALSMSVFLSSYSPLIGEAVEPHQVATGYGFSYSVVNGGCAVGFMLAGIVTDEYGYQASELLYTTMLIGALMFWLAAWILRKKKMKLDELIERLSKTSVI